jgi:hypothetical protein
VLRLRDDDGVTHAGDWVWGEWIGRTACGWEFATPKNQWQRTTSEGLLVAKQAPYGGPRKMTVLNATAHADCMTCLVRSAHAP